MVTIQGDNLEHPLTYMFMLLYNYVKDYIGGITMISKKQIVKKTLTCFLALSMIAGTGAAAVGASAKTIEIPAAVTEKINAVKEKIAQKLNDILPKEKVDAFIAQITEKVMAEYQAAEAKADALIAEISEELKAELAAVTGQAEELINQIVDEMIASLPEETKAQIEQIAAILSQEGMPEELCRQFIAEFVNALYSQALEAVELAGQVYEQAQELIGKAYIEITDLAKQAYEALPEEYKAQIAAAVAQAQAAAAEFEAKITEVLEQVKALEAAVKEKIGKYSVQGKYVLLKEGDFTYRITVDLKHGVSAIADSYEGKGGKITIPAKADGITVTGVSFFTEAKVTAITLPETIEYLDGLAFWGMPSLKYVFVNAKNPNYKSVKGIVFSKDGSTVVCVPSANDYSPAEGVTAIGDYAYAFSPNTAITLPSTIQSIGDGAFGFAEKLEEITVPDGVEKIGSSTFFGCHSLKKITLPSSVKEIAEDAFIDVPEDIVFYCASGADAAARFAAANGFQVSAPLYAAFEATKLSILGADATFRINASYGAGDYKYSFLIRKAGAEKWTKLQIDKENDVIHHAFNSTGTYEVCMKVKDADGTIVKNYSYVKVIQTLNNLSKISSETASVGETVTVNCKAVDPKTTFAVYYKEASASKWIAAQKYNANKTVDITFDQAGSYEICVKAKSAIGFISKKYFAVTVE